LVCFYQPELLLLLQGYNSLRRGFKCVDSFAATKDRQGFLFIELVLISIFTVNILELRSGKE